MSVHLSKWDEARILEYFRFAMRQEDVDRVALLRQLAGVAVQRSVDWSPALVRAEHVAGERKMADRCFCCRTGDRRLYWHHVIAIQHGGSNVRDNLVPICLRCHAAVHPWMDGAKPDRRRTSWSSPLQIFGDIDQTLPEGYGLGELVAAARDKER